jgi:hypothetical protein
VGITSSQRLKLDDGSITRDAHFQAVDIFKPRYETARGLEINFRDTYKFNIAAYRLDKLPQRLGVGRPAGPPPKDRRAV